MKIKAIVDHEKLRQQEKLAKETQIHAMADVERFRQELEAQHGIPIKVIDQPGYEQSARSRSRWQDPNAPDYHMVALNSQHDWERPYLLGHELIHIALEAEAYAAGEYRTIMGNSKVMAALSTNLAPFNANFPPTLYSFTQNVPTDLVVESRIQRDFPSLHPARCVFLNRSELQKAKDGLKLNEPWIQQPRFRFLVALMGVQALWKDRTFDTNHFWRWRGTAAQHLSEQLLEAFSTFQPGPGAHYRFIEHCAELGGFPGMFVMDPRPVWEIVAAQRNQSSNSPSM